MANKKFAMIDTSLPYSEKYRRCSVLEKLVYNHLHYSSLTNYIGCFKYRSIILADEIDISPSELEGALANLEANNLIERDLNDGIIRIIGWFRKANRATNASHAMMLIKNFKEIDFYELEILFRAISEFTVSTMKRGESWATDNDKLRAELGPFLKGLVKDYGDIFASTLIDEIDRAGRSLRPEICSLAPTLLEFDHTTLSTPCPTGGGDKRKRQDETYTNKTKNQNIEIEPAVDLKGTASNREDVNQPTKVNEPSVKAKTGGDQKGASNEAKMSKLAKGKQ